jgi:carboxyl-terminal processing protease
MTDSPAPRPHNERPPPVYLPYLTGILLCLLGLWFVIWSVSQRTAEARRVDSFREALRFISRHYVYAVDQEDVYRAAMEAMVDSLNDRYSAYVTPAENTRIQAAAEGEFGGIGVVVSSKDGGVVVVEVDPDGPAGRAGVQPGDLVTRVDGEDVTSLPLEQVVDRIRGKIGTNVRVGFHRPDSGEDLELDLKRARISIPNVTSEMLRTNIGYIRLRTFDRDCASEIRRALGELKSQGMTGLIIDLRGNPGGLKVQAVEIADYFLSGSLILSVRSRGASTEIDRAHRATLVDPALPIVCLVDENSASASEILAGSLQANGRAVVVGVRTRGKGAVTRLVELEDKSALNLTVEHYELAGGKVVEGTGIEPDEVVGALPRPPGGPPGAREAWRDRIVSARQEQLDRALAILEEKMAQ